MKKKLFYVMAASLAFTACTDDLGYENNLVADSSMVEVSDVNFVVGRGADADSRAAWVENDNDGLSFRWTSAEDAIGMAYVGSATGKLGVTNYKFVADSLRFNDAEVVLKGTPDKTKSVSMFFPVNANSIILGSDYYTNYTYADDNEDKILTIGSSASAKFKTVNDQIMKGYYVTYYPFDEEYTEAGKSIPVKSPKRVSGVTVANNLGMVGEHTFSYSAPAEVKAGAQVTEFALKNLSSVLRIKVANEGELEDAKKIKSVALRTKGNDAFVVKGTLNDPAAAPSASNITVDATEGKTATLFLDYAHDGEDASADNCPSLAAGETKPADGAKGDTLTVYFPVLPTTFNASGIEVILIDEENMACVLNANFKNATTTIPAGVQASLNAKLTKDNKFDQSFVTSPEDLQTAINSAKTATSATTINLLGDITSENLNMHDVSVGAWGKGVTINASAGSKLVLKNPNIALYNKTSEEDENGFSTLTINAPLTIEGGKLEGTVNVDDVTFKGNVSVGHATNLSDNYYGQLTIKGDATVEDEAGLTSAYAFGTGVTVAKDATLTIKKGGKFVNGNFCFNYSNRNYYKNDLFINGTVTVEEGAVMEDKGDTNISSTGKLVVKGTYTNNNQLNVAGGSIEIAGTMYNEAADAAAMTSNMTGAGNIKMSSGNLILAESGKIYNKASLNCAGTFANNGEFYDYVGSVYGGNPFTSNGTYACYVNSQTRLMEAVTRLNIYAANKYQKVILQELSGTANYDLNEIDAEKAAKLNLVNEGDVKLTLTAPNGVKKEDVVVRFNSLTVVDEKQAEGVTETSDKVTIDCNIEFVGATIAEKAVAPVTVAERATLIIENDLTVKANGEIVNAGTFDLKEAENVTAIPATVYCTKAVVTTGTWTNYPIITASENFWK